MKKVCKACGSALDDFVFIFQPVKTQQIVEELKTKLPGVVFSIDAVAGNRVKVETKQELNPGQTTTLKNYFISKNYVEDVEAEGKEVYG